MGTIAKIVVSYLTTCISLYDVRWFSFHNGIGVINTLHGIDSVASSNNQWMESDFQMSG